MQWKSTDSLFTDSNANHPTTSNHLYPKRPPSAKFPLPRPFKERVNNRKSEINKEYPDEVFIKKSTNYFTKLRQQITQLENKAKQSYGLKFQGVRNNQQEDLEQEDESPAVEFELLRSESLRDFKQPAREDYNQMVQ